jgi:iron(III) transport system ATP-binding protein
MKEGNIMQIGRPEEIYRKPANPFVANFIGVSNFVDCTVDGQDPKAASVKLHDGYSFQMPLRAPYSGEVILSARPEQLFFSEKGIPGKVNLSVFLGDFIQYEVQLHTGQVLELNEYTKDVDSAKADGEEVHISFNPKQVSLYRKDTEEVLSC